MTSLEFVPTRAEMFDYYGVPDANNDHEVDRNWLNTRTSVYKLPYPMVASWRDTLIFTRMRVHDLVAPAMMDAFRAILSQVGIEELQARKWDRTGGVFCYRPAKGDPTMLSTHSLAAAVDVNPHLGLYGKKTSQPSFIVSAFEVRGFVWGGHWKMPHTDGMHLQAVK